MSTITTTRHHERAEQYCRNVVDGTITAGRWIKLAAARHLVDLTKQDDPAFPFIFNPKKANRVCKFAELIPHVKAAWARRRETLVLEPWQCFVLCAIFGWLRKHDGLRRFRTALIFVPRKNGKSLLASVIGLYMLAMDGEAGAEVLCGATSLDQAGFVFQPAKAIVEKTAALRELGIQVLAHSLVVPATGSRMLAVIGQPPDGSNPSAALLDEAHEFVNDILISTMVTGMGSREQPLLLVTTTAGFNTASPAKLMQDELQDVLNGHTHNDELFGVIYTVDEGVDWRSELALRQANPNFDVSVRGDYLAQQQREAIDTPRKLVPFKTKHLNIWTSTAATWLPLERWNACADPNLKLDDFLGEPCWAGLDLANKLDLTAYVKVFKRDGKFFVFPKFYLPEKRTEDIANAHYRTWQSHGYLEATPGEVNDHRLLLDDILADAGRFDMREIAHDPYGAAQLVGQIIDHRLTCIEVTQTWKGMSEPMKALEAAVLAGNLVHDGNPVLAWNVANTKVRQDRNENIVPDKESPEKKIDGVVSLVMALGRAQIAKPAVTAGFLFWA